MPGCCQSRRPGASTTRCSSGTGITPRGSTCTRSCVAVSTRCTSASRSVAGRLADSFPAHHATVRIDAWRRNRRGRRRRSWHWLRRPASASGPRCSWRPTVFQARLGYRDVADETIGIRDLVIGSGACAALLRGGDGDFRRWAAFGLISDSADLLLGLRSRPLVGTKSALIATLAPVPFVGGGVRGFVRSLGKAGRP